MKWEYLAENYYVFVTLKAHCITAKHIDFVRLLVRESVKQNMITMCPYLTVFFFNLFVILFFYAFYAFCTQKPLTNRMNTLTRPPFHVLIDRSRLYW